MRRPMVLWSVVAFGSLATVSNVLETRGAFAMVGARPLSEVLGHAAISSAVATASIWVTMSLVRKSFQSTLPVSIYLWGMLIIYPLYDLLRAAGLYLPSPELTGEQLAGAAVVELLRYLVILFLIGWVGSSKALRSHLAGRSLHASQTEHSD